MIPSSSFFWFIKRLLVQVHTKSGEEERVIRTGLRPSQCRILN